MIDSMMQLFHDLLKDTYNAENQFLKGMRKLADASSSADLRQAFEEHITQTQGHIERLEQVAKSMNINPGGKACKAAQGLIDEAEENLSETEPGPVRDASIIAIAQKCEHYEISAYGTLIAWAKELDASEAESILKDTLKEEINADGALTKVAKHQVNEEAVQLKSGSATVY